MYFGVFKRKSWGKRSAQIEKGVFFGVPKTNKTANLGEAPTFTATGEKSYNTLNDSTPHNVTVRRIFSDGPATRPGEELETSAVYPFPSLKPPSLKSEGTDVYRTSIDSLFTLLWSTVYHAQVFLSTEHLAKICNLKGRDLCKPPCARLFPKKTGAFLSSENVL